MAVDVAIFGANGQLGSDVFELFRSDPDISRLWGFTQLDLDVERDDIEAFLEENLKSQVDVIINCVAYTDVDGAERQKDRAFVINALFPDKLAEFCNKKDIVLFHISTDYVFSGEKGTAYVETDMPCPINVYGKTKLEGERRVLAKLKKSFIFRTSALFGRKGAFGKKTGNFVMAMINLAKSRSQIKVVNDQFSSPTHTLDVARALLFFVKEGIMDFGIYHCCSSGGCSWYEFAVEIFSQLNMKVELVPVGSDEFPTLARRPRFSVMDNAKLNRYVKMPVWKDALMEYLSLCQREGLC